MDVSDHCKLGQLFPESLSSVENAALHCAHRNAQLLRDFVVVKAVQKHRKWFAEIVLQRGNSRLDIVNVDHRSDGVMVIVLIRIQEELILCLVHYCVLETLLLVVVDEDVPHDGVQPTFNVRALLEIVLVSQGFDESLLDQVIGIFSIPGEAHGKAGKEVLMRNQEVIEF